MLKPADRAVTTMFVAHDHLGVRSIVCATPESTVISKIQEEPGLWWHTIPLKDDCAKIKAELDGVKIRSMYREGERGHDKHYWPRPMPASSYPRIIEIFTKPAPFPRIKRMKPLVLNGVGMRALSACFSNYCSKISAHYAGLPDLNYGDQQTNSNGTLWLHFILDKGEQISEIWNWENIIRGKGIVFRTNKGRIWTCSRQPMRGGSTPWSAFNPTRWDHLADLPPGEPTTIYLEESWTSITRLALHSEAPVQGVKEPPLETVTFEEGPDNKKPGYFNHLDGAHCSSAPLAGLATITPCWGKTLGHAREQEEGAWHTPGLILRYEDGRARVLGQVRLDSLGQPYDVTTCGGVSLRYVWEKAMLENVQLGKLEIMGGCGCRGMGV
ncbi:uncharacterized protein B0J16DRAFT_417520 [Fusarium flagelliforme]|uniref:Uncharacterized protein n=1 Tax=Fusarium flagelliforme TaxID=2675880 RepID=A0A395MCD7_9HYPO|nr:uncharacterized protein B0J16DRAFT_417520 [Fusarium flagelliforme]KAH7179901.1 hypothetical protein B0J16DRAFT_417520 [Fusarium flagelliforme]RFN45538.1 hypothetical protein FIE12Z_10208 [Fusarium flagelliforme]